MKLPSFIRIVKPALPRFKASIPLVMFLLACGTLAWVWIYGAQWKVAEYYPLETQLSRWLVTALLVLLGVCWMTVKFMARVQHLEKLQLQLKTHQDDPMSADVAQQNHYLNRWKHQLQRQLGTPAYLYRLPWYMVIGGRKSGKTTFIREGYKLNDITAQDHRRMESAEELRVRCWLGEQAVIIDPAGELIEQPVCDVPEKALLNHRLWKSLLEWLLTERARQPLNGIILIVDLHHLLTATKTQREMYITDIHQRLLEVQLSLHVEVPLYVVFTKMDLLYGFGAMYQTLTKAQREAVLGVTFSMDASAWREELHQFWRQWVAQ